MKMQRRERAIWPALAMTLLVTLGVSGATQGQIYKYTDPDGNVVFSDKPPADTDNSAVEEVEIRTPNSTPPPTQRPTYEERSKSDSGKIEYETRITSPEDGATIPMGPGDFSVTASVQPALKGTEKIQLKLGAEVVGEPQRRGNWQLTNVFRGEHQLVVERLNRSGTVLHRSAPVTVYVLRPSVR